jgi:hypothetical protein
VRGRYFQIAQYSAQRFQISKCRALLPGPIGCATARGVAAIASGMAERDADVLCCHPTLSTPFAALMLDIATRPERVVAEGVVEYFLMVNTVARDAR